LFADIMAVIQQEDESSGWEHQEHLAVHCSSVLIANNTASETTAPARHAPNTGAATQRQSGNLDSFQKKKQG
jgi:hypothetical protein